MYISYYIFWVQDFILAEFTMQVKKWNFINKFVNSDQNHPFYGLNKSGGPKKNSVCIEFVLNAMHTQL